MVTKVASSSQVNFNGVGWFVSRLTMLTAASTLSCFIGWRKVTVNA